MGQALSSDRTSLAPGLGARGTVLRVCVRHPQDDLNHNAVETLNRSLRTGPRARQSPPVSLWAGRCPKAGPRGIARPGGPHAARHRPSQMTTPGTPAPQPARIVGLRRHPDHTAPRPDASEACPCVFGAGHVPA